MVWDLYPRIYTDEFYLTLGRFVSDFSEIEQALQIALWQLAKVDSPVAQAVFSGVRAAEATSKIARIGVAEKWSETRTKEWEAISSQIGNLRSFRNDILHYGVKWERPGEWIATNRQFVHTPEKITNSPVTIAILQAAIEDLGDIALHIFNFLYRPDDRSLSASDRAELNPWKYKPHPQATDPNSNPDNAPKQKRQQRPSAAGRRKAAQQKREDNKR